MSESVKISETNGNKVVEDSPKKQDDQMQLMKNNVTKLCHIKKRSSFDGYGFNLHSEKGKNGQYIGKVDENSPAESAGLYQGDCILEVNGKSIENMTHKQVVELIKADKEETKLLVITSTTDCDNDIAKDNENSSNKHNDKDSQSTGNGTLNLSMTAAELRAKLASKKKFDPKKELLDSRQKFNIVQTL